MLSHCEVLVRYLIVYLEGFEEKWEELKWNYDIQRKVNWKKKLEKIWSGTHCSLPWGSYYLSQYIISSLLMCLCVTRSEGWICLCACVTLSETEMWKVLSDFIFDFPLLYTFIFFWSLSVSLFVSLSFFFIYFCHWFSMDLSLCFMVYR